MDEIRTELDSHADTCVLVDHALVIHDHERPVKVTGYNDQDGTKTYRTVDATLAYNDPTTGTSSFYKSIKLSIFLDSTIISSCQCNYV